MRFDFGASGVAALERLKATGSAEVRRFADTALAAEFPYDLPDTAETMRARTVRRNIRLVPGGGPVPTELSDIFAPSSCVGGEHCILFHQPGAGVAVLVTPGYCHASMAGIGINHCEPDVALYYRDGAHWRSDPPRPDDDDAARERHRRLAAAVAAGRAEIRTVPKRQVFVDGEPVGSAF
jgi:hypothetical protein